MKIKILSLAIIALFFASCGGVDKQLMDNINSFENDWTKFSASVNSTGEKIKMESETMMKDCDETCGMSCDNKKMSASIDSCKDACKMDKEAMASLLTNFNDFKTNTVDKTTADFTAWKDKVSKGEIKGEAANKDLEAFKAKKTEANEQLTAFGSSMEDVKSSCQANCNAVKEKCAMMNDKDKKSKM
jgi:hypothetical protein